MISEGRDLGCRLTRRPNQCFKNVCIQIIDGSMKTNILRYSQFTHFITDTDVYVTMNPSQPSCCLVFFFRRTVEGHLSIQVYALRRQRRGRLLT